MATDTPPDRSVGALRRRLDAVTLDDQRRLRRQLDRARTTRDPDRRTAAIARVAAAIDSAQARLERRKAAVPALVYPEALPVSQRRDEIASAIRDHQVVIVAGETGSGKTTQLPKICLELGRGVRGMIGHTQPRRLAARTVADRIAEELHTELGGAVGFAVRFDDRVSDTTLVKLMTDGILLTDIHRDRTLSAYDTLIIDEAHERSLNIDFILGYLKQLLPKRPDLKVVVTSATIDPERFAAHFDGTPIIEVSGRTFPVEYRYRPLPETGTGRGEGRGDGRGDRPDRFGRDQIQGICDAVEELRNEAPGDVLVFLAGERDIRDAADALSDLKLSDTEILPLYARLSHAEQHRVFASHAGRRIVLATNVAETSLTVPGIRYVVDPGTARISRYSHRLKVQRLPIERVSQASANQRAGRCGRVAPGICIRLYDEEDFASRPEFTEPEILRTNLASVILQMTWLGLGDIAAFPFVEPPDRRAIADGVRLLDELGALEADRTPTAPDATGDEYRLTPIGRQLARLPVDPRFARMVLEADALGCLHEVLIIASALSIEDPRERPSEKAAAADQYHARFAHPDSDFLSYLELWTYTRERQRALSSNQFRKLCRTEFLNHLRLREWQDVYTQLRQVANELGMRQSHNASTPDAIHQALLAGLLSHIGNRDRETREFRGARQAKFAIFPGSTLAKKPPPWVMAAELVETSRLWARTAAKIQPEWAEALAPHLVKHAYTEPHWSTKRGAAMVYESVTLYGLPIVTRRLVGYGTIDPEHARELFIRHGLVEGDWRTPHPFVQHNRDVLAEAEALGQRFRRRDLLIDDDALFSLYDERIDLDIVSGRHFDSWWKQTRRRDPDLLTFTPDLFLVDEAEALDPADFPDEWHQGALRLPITYAFDTHENDDEAEGATVHIPLAVLNQVRPIGFDWQVPGLRRERVIALIRSLPKPLRRNLVPVPEYADRVLDATTVAAGTEPLLDVLTRDLSRLGGDRIPRDAWDPSRLAPHLSITYRVEDDAGTVLGQGQDLAALQRRLSSDVRATVTAATRGLEQVGLREWSFGTLERRVRRTVGDRVVVGFPTLVDEGETVAVRVLDNEGEQHETMWAGTRRLLRLTVALPARATRRQLLDGAGLALAANPYPSSGALVEDCLVTALDTVMTRHDAPVWDAVAFDALRAAARAELEPTAREIADRVLQIFDATAAIDRELREPPGPARLPAFRDIAGQRDALVFPGFIAAAGLEHLGDIVRYLQAIRHRLATLTAAIDRDRDRMVQIHQVEAAYARAVDSLAGGPSDLDLERIGWQIEELRVSLFAQHLGTPEPVSAKRILTAIRAL